MSETYAARILHFKIDNRWRRLLDLNSYPSGSLDLKSYTAVPLARFDPHRKLEPDRKQEYT